MTKFNIKDYQGNYAMVCNTRKKSDVFRNYLNSVGKTWHNGESYSKYDYYDQEAISAKSEYNLERDYINAFHGIVYYFNQDIYALNLLSIDETFKIISFDDFDWN